VIPLQEMFFDDDGDSLQYSAYYLNVSSSNESDANSTENKSSVETRKELKAEG
jgi:hypothetical protein